jgi:hypothetical protein
MSKRRKSGDMPSKAEMKEFSASCDKVIKRTPREKAFLARITKGVERRMSKDK